MLGFSIRSGRFSLLLLTFVLSCFGLAVAQVTDLQVELSMNSGRVTVREQWTFAQVPEALSRTVYLDPWVGRFPLRQRVVHLVAPEHRRLDYGFDRTYLGFTPARTLNLEYQLLGMIADNGTADLTLHFYEMPEIERLSVSFSQGQASSFVYDADFEKNLFGPDGGAVARGVPAGRSLRIKLSDSKAEPSSPGVQEYLRQLGPALGLGALGLLVGLSLRSAPPRRVILWARTWNVLLLLLVLGLMAPMVVFDLISPQYRGLSWVVNLVSILVVYLGLLGAFGAFVGLQEKMLKEGQPTAYYLQFSLPALTLLLLPAGLVQPAFWLLPGVALLGLVCWTEKRLALYLGAANHVLLESITAKGEVSLKDLAEEFDLPEGRLLKLLQRENVVVDHDRGVALSPATASHRQNLALCPACGGATEVKGQMALICPFCDREYAATRETLLPRPVPVVVQAQASAFSVLGGAVLVWTGMLVLVGFLDEALKEGVSAAIFYSGAVALAGGVVGGGLVLWSTCLRDGLGGGILRWTTGLLTPRALRTRRVKIHFQELPNPEVETEISVKELAQQLACSRSEAGELARYLASVSELTFDRLGDRLVSKALWEELAGAGSCRGCGGVLGVIGGKVICHFCGEGL